MSIANGSAGRDTNHNSLLSRHVDQDQNIFNNARKKTAQDQKTQITMQRRRKKFFSIRRWWIGESIDWWFSRWLAVAQLTRIFLRLIHLKSDDLSQFAALSSLFLFRELAIIVGGELIKTDYADYAAIFNFLRTRRP